MIGTKVQRILNSPPLSATDSSLPRTPELPWEAEELERQLQSKLNLPLRYHRGRDHASSSRAIGDVVIGLRKDRVIEGVEKLGPKLKIEPVCHIEHFSRRQVCCFLSRSFKNVFVRIAETTVGAVGNRKVVGVEPQARTGMRESSTTDLVGALQPRRTSVAWVESDGWREGEARAERNNSAYVPSAKNRIGQATPVHELLAFSYRQQVVDAIHPALAIIEVRQPFFCRDIVAVLRPRSVAADFGLVVNGFAESKCTQEIQAMAGPLFGLDLKCVIRGISFIRDGRESPILALEGGRRIAVRSQGRVVRRLGRGNLVVVAQDLQVSAFRPDIARTD